MHPAVYIKYDKKKKNALVSPPYMLFIYIGIYNIYSLKFQLVNNKIDLFSKFYLVLMHKYLHYHNNK